MIIDNMKTPDEAIDESASAIFALQTIKEFFTDFGLKQTEHLLWNMAYCQFAVQQNVLEVKDANCRIEFYLKLKECLSAIHLIHISDYQKAL